VPLFYERDEDGLPQRWLALLRASLRSLAVDYNAHRMLRDYRERVYLD
jgi:starch phosphorylase